MVYHRLVRTDNSVQDVEYSADISEYGGQVRSVPTKDLVASAARMNFDCTSVVFRDASHNQHHVRLDESDSYEFVVPVPREIRFLRGSDGAVRSDSSGSYKSGSLPPSTANKLLRVKCTAKPAGGEVFSASFELFSYSGSVARDASPTVNRRVLSIQEPAPPAPPAASAATEVTESFATKIAGIFSSR